MTALLTERIGGLPVWVVVLELIGTAALWGVLSGPLLTDIWQSRGGYSSEAAWGITMLSMLQFSLNGLFTAIIITLVHIALAGLFARKGE